MTITINIQRDSHNSMGSLAKLELSRDLADPDDGVELRITGESRRIIVSKADMTVACAALLGPPFTCMPASP